jgi:hypothetical protein
VPRYYSAMDNGTPGKKPSALSMSARPDGLTLLLRRMREHARVRGVDPRGWPETFGNVPEDIVGLLAGDWIKVRRAENIASTAEKAKERLKARKMEAPEPASLSLALPIFVAAAEESRDELQDLWAFVSSNGGLL